MAGVVAADFDGDGAPEIAVATRDGRLLIISAKGAHPAIRIDANADLVAADFNVDGKVDLGVIRYDTPGLTVLFGRADLSFDRGPVLMLPGMRGVGVADINGDGIPDLLVAQADCVRVLLGDGRGGFGEGPVIDVAAAAATSAYRSLTPREREVASLASAGFTCSEIAVALRISRRTAENHILVIRSKLNLGSKRELVRV